MIDAEKKRREESNAIMKEFIVEYLQDLESNIANKVDGQFNELKNRVDKIDQNLKNIEREVETQIQEVHEYVEKRTVETDKELNIANNLLVSSKEAH